MIDKTIAAEDVQNMVRSYVSESASYSAKAEFRMPIDEFRPDIARDMLIWSEHYKILHEQANSDENSAGVVVYEVAWRHIDSMVDEGVTPPKYALSVDDD